MKNSLGCSPDLRGTRAFMLRCFRERRGSLLLTQLRQRRFEDVEHSPLTLENNKSKRGQSY